MKKGTATHFSFLKSVFSLLLAALACLSAGCWRSVPQDMRETLQGEACRFEDGTPVFLWEDIFGYESYRLSDGTTLLNVRCTAWPWNTSVGGLEGFEGMSPQAQQAVRAYFEEQGTLYDLSAQLDSAYMDYTQCLQEAGKPESSSFQSHQVWQETYPTGETERFTAFCTALTLPKEERYDGTVTENRVSAIFDRETGGRIDGFDLFSIPEQEVGQALAGRCPGQMPLEKEEWIRALRPECLIWYPEGLEIFYPPGALSGLEDGLTTSIGFSDLKDILQPWALP